MVDDEDDGYPTHDLFQGVDELLDEVEKEIEQLMANFKRDRFQLLRHPFVKGFAVDFEEGRPVLKTFGDVDAERGDREPLVEQTVKDDTLVIIAELPGVEKSDIQIEANEDTISLKAGSGDRVYKTLLHLKEPIDPDSSKARYTNGILEVRAKLKGKGNKGYKGIRVD